MTIINTSVIGPTCASCNDESCLYPNAHHVVTNIVKVMTYLAPFDIVCSCGNFSMWEKDRMCNGFYSCNEFGRVDSNGPFMRCGNCGLVGIGIPTSTPDAMYPIESPKTWNVTAPIWD